MNFFKTLLAVILGNLVSIGLGFILLIMMFAGLVASMKDNSQKVEIKSNSILHITLKHPITERSSEDPFSNISFSGTSTKDIGLDDFKRCLQHAATDDEIKGIYLDLGIPAAGQASLQEIRDELIAFKKSGKFIVAYSEIYTESNYFIASVADKVYLNPAGEMLFNGVFADVMFFAEGLKKLGVEMQAIRHGKFKSAVEPFVSDKMSEANREQITRYVGSIYDNLLDQIAASRKTTREELFSIADDLKIRKAEDAVTYKLVDQLAFLDEVQTDLRKRINIGEKDKLPLVSISKYSKSFSSSRKGEHSIAVVYAVGEIMSGEGDDETIGSDRIAEAIRKARLDDNVKAVVLRVNSPGGSAMASDVIWREVVLTKKVKPVIVSMGDVAASGGYYIATAADVIVAQPNTITGSIGVFGLLPNAQVLLNDKLGIHIDGVKIGKYSDLGRADRPLNAEETAIIQGMIERIYDDFISKVAEGRKMEKSQVDSIAQGRVWSGINAKEIGLVDELGGLDRAIAIAAEKAKLTDYKIKSLPRMKNSLETLMKALGEETQEDMLKSQLGSSYEAYKNIRRIMGIKGIQARLPYEISIQ